MLPGVFPNKVTSDVDFTDEPVVQWYEYLCTVTGPSFVYSFNF